MGTLHLFFTTELPDDLPERDPEDGKRKLIITGFEDRSEDLPLEPGEIEYVSILASNFRDPVEVCEAVDKWWSEYAGVLPSLELVADDLSRISEEDRREFADHTDQSFRFLTAFVGFESSSTEARGQAVDLVLQIATVLH